MIKLTRRQQEVLLLLLCGWNQCELHGPLGPLTIGEHRVRTICEVLRTTFGNGKGRQSMRVAIMNAREMGLKQLLLDALKDEKKLMKAARARERKLALPEVELL